MSSLTSYFPYIKQSSHVFLIIIVLLSWNVVLFTVTCLGEKNQLQSVFMVLVFLWFTVVSE